MARSLSARARVRSALLYLWLVIAVIVVCFPLYYIFEGALTPTAWLDEGLEGLLPIHLTLDNVIRATQVIPLGHQFLNSVVVTLVQTFFQVAIGRHRLRSRLLRAAGHACPLPADPVEHDGAGRDDPHRELSDDLVVATDRHPAGGVPAVPGLGAEHLPVPAGVPQLPGELRDAALLDGAGHVRFIRSMLLPIVQPTLISVTLVSATAAWNGFFWPLLVTNSPENRTVQVGIAQLSSAEAADVGVVLAGAAMVTLPVLVLVLLAQRFLAGGITAGALK